jgi:hypothetical protein
VAIVPDKWLVSPGTPSVLAFSVADSVPPNSPYVLGAASFNPGLVGASATNDPGAGYLLIAAPATNQAGSTTINLSVTDAAHLSSTTPIQVTVAAQPLGLQLFGKTNLGWSSYGNAFWFGQTAVTHSGVKAAQSGDIDDGQESWLRTSVVGPGRLSFWWRVSSEANFDYLEFYWNGILQPGRISGTNVNWQQLVYFVNQGTNVLAWCYSKDENVSLGADAGWLDEVTFSPGPWLEIAPGSSSTQRQLMLHGVAGRSYRVQVSTNLVNWLPREVVVATNSSMIFIDTGATNRTQFYRVQDPP